MSSIAGVTRVAHSDREGTGLEAWDPIDPDSLVSGTPVQRGRLDDSDEAAGYLAGVWDCTAFTGHTEPYPDDEFMLLLEGRLVMRMPDGTAVPVEEGEAFVIPKGLECQWEQPDYVRKVFMIVSDPVEEAADNPSLTRITKPDLALGPAEGTVATAHTWFENSTARMSVAVEAHAGGEAPGAASPDHELIHVLAGALTLSAGGAGERIAAGETVYIRAGTAVARTHAPGTRLVVSRYRPAA